MTIFIKPASYFEALTQFGGYLSLLGVLDVLLMLIHEYFFERNLKNRIRELALKDRDKREQSSSSIVS